MDRADGEEKRLFVKELLPEHISDSKLLWDIDRWIRFGDRVPEPSEELERDSD